MYILYIVDLILGTIWYLTLIPYNIRIYIELLAPIWQTYLVSIYSYRPANRTEAGFVIKKFVPDYYYGKC